SEQWKGKRKYGKAAAEREERQEEGANTINAGRKTEKPSAEMSGSGKSCRYRNRKKLGEDR
ncbi:MAG TPA: hypothetical protein VF790_13625, partial [Dissulfurispiraceae bacterium]